MTQIAIASGFGCVRQFNAAIRNTYQRTPTQIRRVAKAPDLGQEDRYVLRLSYRPPYNWKGLLAYLAARATPGVEVVEDNKYCRTITLNGTSGYLEVRFRPESDELVLQLHFADSRCLFAMVERVRGMFDLGADWAVIGAILRRDPMLCPLIDQNPGLRVAGCWDGFELSTRAILGQQVSVAAATTLAGRMASKFGQAVQFGDRLTRLFPTPEALADADLASIGLPKSRAATVRALARTVCAGEISYDRVRDPQVFIKRLLDVRGIGKWTAQYVAMRALREPDAFPSEDLGLMRGMGFDKPADVERRSQGWRPWRAYAAMYIWSMGSGRTNYNQLGDTAGERRHTEAREHASSSLLT